MAGGGRAFSNRATTEGQNEEESVDYQLIVKHFKENKVEIASAITKPFPFLMSLRDRGIISEEKFQDCQERCEKLEPVDRVVYDILCDLQKKFNWKLLKVIFSKTHLKAYPDLEEILQSFFQNALDNHRTFQRMNGRDAEKRPRLSAGDREASCSAGTSQKNDVRAEEVPSLTQCVRGERSSSCEQRLDGQEPQDGFPSSLRCEARAEQPTSEEMCSCVMCSPTNVAEDPEASLGSSEREAVDTGNNITVEKPRKRRGKRKKGHNWSKLKQRRQPQNASRIYGQAAFWRKKPIKSSGCSAKLRAPRRRRSENADFSAELLPVTCGNLKGVLHKNKFKQGISVMSIQCEDGNWFTPSEFELMGGFGKSKNWKLSLRCNNWPLKFLIERNFLPKPPRVYAKRRREMQNSDECEMCGHEGKLFCCDTCPRAFHEECHIPAVDSEKIPWSCIFCRIQSLGSQESRPESEILQRQMVPQEQLRCEFVLLKVYCCPEGSFFTKMPHYCYFGDLAREVQEPMWLDRIKRKLSEQAYSKVEEFVNDMRLIFRNHRTTYKDAKFGQMGFILESKFETNFKEVFAIQETNENS